MKTINNFITESKTDDILIYTHTINFSTGEKQIFAIKNDDKSIKKFVSFLFRDKSDENKDLKILDVKDSITLSKYLEDLVKKVNKEDFEDILEIY